MMRLPTRARLGTSAVPICLAMACLAGTPPITAEAQVTFTQERIFDVPEANQGVGVDRDYFYAVNNQTITKHNKDTGVEVARWDNPVDGGIIHMDSAFVRGGKIYAAHSNYNILPQTSSVEIFDAKTMEHIDTHSFGRLGNGTFNWLDRHNGYWWGTFATYQALGGADPFNVQTGAFTEPGAPNPRLPYGGGKINTTVAQMDDDFNILQTWILPNSLLVKFETMSNSGGSWGPDGYLYLAGHDPAEVYKTRLPKAGSIIEVVETIPLNIRGQGIAWDRYDRQVLWGVIRSNNTDPIPRVHKVVKFRSNITIPVNQRDGRDRVEGKRDDDR